MRGHSRVMFSRENKAYTWKAIRQCTTLGQRLLHFLCVHFHANFYSRHQSVCLLIGTLQYTNTQWE